MSRYNTEIKLSCGHTETFAMNCRSSELDNKVKWYEEVYAKDHVCKDCYRKQIEAEREQERIEAQARAEANSLPELEGSPKQVAWAVTIRDRLLQELAECIKRHDPETKRIATAKLVLRTAIANGLLDNLMAIQKYLSEQTSAKYFIDYWQRDHVAEGNKLIPSTWDKNYMTFVNSYYNTLEDAKKQVKASLENK